MGQPGGQADPELQRLLERAESDDAARSELLGRMLELTLHAATWRDAPDALRTLRNAAGEQAMALFSQEAALAAAADALGWTQPDGSLASRTVNAREALEAGLSQGVSFVVIDLESPHALELTRDELALRLAMSAKRAPAAAPQSTSAAPRAEQALIDIDLPFVHGRGERESLRIDQPQAHSMGPPVPRAAAAAPGPPKAPPSVERPARPAPVAEQTAARSPQAALQASGGAPKPATTTRAAKTIAGNAPLPAAPNDASAGAPKAPTAAKAPVEESKASPIKAAARALATMIGTGSEASAEPQAGEAGSEPIQFAEGALRPLELGSSDTTLSALADALRAFPEVEWACEASDGTELPVIGVRVSPQFTTRVAEIEAAALAAAKARGAELRVLILSDAALMREARTHGAAFYPWRKRPGRK